MLVIRLSGHSGAGKSRLLEALANYGMKFKKAVFYTSRPPRIGEIDAKDYFFVSRSVIENLPRERYFVGQVRDMMQAIDLCKLEEDILSGELVIIEIFHSLWPELKKRISSRLQNEFQTLSIFITTLDPKMLRKLSDAEMANVITNEVKGILTIRNKETNEKILIRAHSAIGEIVEAIETPKLYDRIILSSPEGPDGADEWTKPGGPMGQAKKALKEFLAIVKSFQLLDQK